MLPVLQATAAALLFGLSAPLAKILVGAVSPWSLAGLLYLGAGGFLTVVRLGRRGRPDLGTAFQASDRWWLAGVVLAGGILAPPLLLWGLARAPAASIALLLNTEVIFTALIAAALFREHVGARILGATGLVALGGMAVEWSGSGPALSTAAVATLVACGLWGLDNNLTRRIAEADPLALVQVKGLAAGTTNLILASLVGSPRPGLASVALGLGLGAVSYGASLVLFVLALRGLGAARAGAYFALAPFLGAAGAVQAVAIHDASGEGLEPTSVSPDVGPMGAQLRAAAARHIAAPTRAIWAVGTHAPPSRHSTLFVLHRALLI